MKRLRNEPASAGENDCELAGDEVNRSLRCGCSGRSGNSDEPHAKLLASFPAPNGAEGYQVRVRKETSAPAVFIIGNDARGVLFGVGRLLRELHMERGRRQHARMIWISPPPPSIRCAGISSATAPSAIPTTPGTCRLGAVLPRPGRLRLQRHRADPARSDDDADSPHFPLPPMEMMQGMSRLADAYGLDVWIWYPAMDKDYSDPKTVESALQEWGEVFAKLRRIDAVFVPGGDPGHTQPKVLMALLEKQTENLHRYHPKAQMWVSPQGFNQAWLDEFLDILSASSRPG